jgi:hypothetical protein
VSLGSTVDGKDVAVDVGISVDGNPQAERNIRKHNPVKLMQSMKGEM